MRKKRVTRVIHIGLHKPQEDVIKKIEQDGYEVTQVVRQMIDEWGRENYPDTPAYVEVERIKAELRKKQLNEANRSGNMTNEEYAEEVLNGQIRGNQVFFRIASGREIAKPLSGIKEVTRENDGVVDIHNQLLDRTYTFNGRPPTEQEWDDIWDGWDEQRPSRVQTMLAGEEIEL